MKYDLSNDIELKQYKTRSQSLIEKGAKVELKVINKAKKVRSVNYLSVCLTMYAQEFDYSYNEAKTIFKRKHPFMVYEKKGTKFLRETNDLNQEEISILIDSVRNDAQDNGLYIPTSNEYLSDKFKIDRKLQHS